MSDVHHYVTGTYTDGSDIYRPERIKNTILLDKEYTGSHGWDIPIETFPSDLRKLWESLTVPYGSVIKVVLTEERTPVSVEVFKRHTSKVHRSLEVWEIDENEETLEEENCRKGDHMWDHSASPQYRICPVCKAVQRIEASIP